MGIKSGYMSSKEQEVIKIYNEVQRKILLFGESTLSESSFRAFRKLVIEEFGHGGAKDKVSALFQK